MYKDFAGLTRHDIPSVIGVVAEHDGSPLAEMMIKAAMEHLNTKSGPWYAKTTEATVTVARRDVFGEVVGVFGIDVQYLQKNSPYVTVRLGREDFAKEVAGGLPTQDVTGIEILWDGPGGKWVLRTRSENRQMPTNFQTRVVSGERVVSLGGDDDEVAIKRGDSIQIWVIDDLGQSPVTPVADLHFFPLVFSYGMQLPNK